MNTAREPVAEIDLDALLERYEVALVDAYGVLVNASGAMPGAAEILAALRRHRRPFFIVTNDSSRLPATHEARFARFGLDIAADQIITSGTLLAPYFAAHGLRDARCAVLGPDDARVYVADAGGVVVAPAVDAECDAVVVCDEDGYPFLDTVDDTLSMLYRHYDRGRDVALILPNPDIVYPKAAGAFGYTSGGVALLLEAGLARRYPGRGLAFTRLGKPHRPIFDEARRRAGTDSLIMIGDQLETDIAGALAAGIDAALVDTGIARWPDDASDAADDAAGAAPSVRPTYILR